MHREESCNSSTVWATSADVTLALDRDLSAAWTVGAYAAEAPYSSRILHSWAQAKITYISVW